MPACRCCALNCEAHDNSTSTRNSAHPAALAEPLPTEGAVSAYGFAAICTLIMIPGLSTTGYLYGWSVWSGTSRGFAVSLEVVLALALLLTRRRVRGKLPFWPWIAFYGFTIALSTIPSAMKLATAFSLWQFGSALVIFAAIAHEAHRTDVRNYLANGLAIGLIYQAGQVLWQKAGGAIQAAGTFGHQNIFRARNRTKRCAVDCADIEWEQKSPSQNLE